MKTTKCNWQEIIDEYIKSKGNDYPSFDDCKVWMIKDKEIPFADIAIGEYKGYIELYSTAWLEKHIATGGRNSGNLMMMYKTIKENNTIIDSVEPVKIINDTVATEKVKAKGKVHLDGKEVE